MTRRFFRQKYGFNRFILFQIGPGIKKYKSLCHILDKLLPIAAILSFVFGLYLLKIKGIQYEYRFNFILYVAVMVISLILHEVGHLISGVSSDYKFYDAGILLIGIIPIGAYVSCDNKYTATKSERIRLSLAGIDMNILIFGICLGIASLFPSIAYTLIVDAIINIVFVIINMLPANGLDGEKLLEGILDVENVNILARRLLLNEQYRKKLVKGGVKGKTIFCVFAAVLFSNLLFWMATIGSLIYTILSII